MAKRKQIEKCPKCGYPLSIGECGKGYCSNCNTYSLPISFECEPVNLIRVECDGKIIGYASGVKNAQQLANQDAKENDRKIKWKKIR